MIMDYMKAPSHFHMTFGKPKIYMEVQGIKNTQNNLEKK